MKKLIYLMLVFILSGIGFAQYDLPGQDESFDPLELAEPALPFMDGTMIYEIITDTDQSMRTRHARLDSLKTVETMGWQIQVFSTRDFFLADSVYQKARQSFPDDEVDKVFNSPYYKIRIGSFINREDAEGLLSNAVRFGYVNSWIIHTKVKVKEKNLPY